MRHRGLGTWERIRTAIGGGHEMPDVHVVPSGILWACEINGHTRSTHETQDEAIKHGRHLAEEQASELVVHAQDGSIREKDSHGNDPRDIPG
jgi:Uncharacterized protein conserved in bacteria (DUF2188)